MVLKIQKYISPTYIILLCLFFWIYLWFNRNHYTIPNPDIFQYIYEGSHYLRGTFPPSIHAPPASPFFINLLATFLQSFPEPELLSAHILNITTATANLAVIFFILRPLSSLLAYAVPFLLATNKIYFLNSVNVTNEVIYSLFFSLVILFYQRKKYHLAYLIAGISFLIRYEAITLLLGLIIVDLYYKNPLHLIFRRSLLALITILPWVFILNAHSTGTNIIQNAYLVEIYNGLTNLPNWRPFITLNELIIINPNYNFDFGPTFLYVFLFTISFYLLKSTTQPSVRLAYILALLHLTFLIIFPNFALRYLLPIIWVIYLVAINHYYRPLKYFFLGLTLTLNFYYLPQSLLNDTKHQGSEYRLVANWLNQQDFPSNIRILIYEPWIIDYFTSNPQVDFIYDQQSSYNLTQHINNCKRTMTCIADKLAQDFSDSSILVITTATSNKTLSFQDDHFTANLHSIDIFQNFPNSVDSQEHFGLITTLDDGQNWAKIYLYFP